MNRRGATGRRHAHRLEPPAASWASDLLAFGALLAIVVAAVLSLLGGKW